MLSILFYLVLFLVVFVVQVLAMRQNNKKIKQFLVLLSFASLLLMMGLRYDVGTDYAGHMGIYNDFANRSVDSIVTGSGDVGAKIIIGSAAHVFHDFKFLFFVYGLLALYPIYRINKNTGYKYLAYSTLVFNLTIMPVCLNLVRQGAAMSFALLAFSYLRSGTKIRKAVLTTVIAAILHPSALVMIPYFAVYVWMKKRRQKVFIWFSLLTLLIFAVLVLFAKDFLSDIGLSDYSYALKLTGAINIYGGVAIYDGVYYAMLATIMLVHRRNGVMRVGDNGVQMAMVVQGTIYEMLGTMTRFLTRVSYYFSIYQVMLIPEILQNINSKNTRVLMKVLVVGTLVGLFIFRCYVQGYYEIIPYRTWIGM